MGYKFLLLSLTLISLMGCASMFEERTFADEMERESDGYFMAGRDFRVMNGDSGEAYRSKSEVKKRTPASRRQKSRETEEVSIENELREKVAAMGEVEKADFDKKQKYFDNDSERLYYLSMNSEDRANYIEMRKSESADEEDRRNDSRAFLEKRSVHSAELEVGMSKTDIQRIWGRPNKVEYAGDPKFQNERWVFSEGGQKRFVYFENGEVNGWSLDL